jgi:hypothetical protein
MDYNELAYNFFKEMQGIYIQKDILVQNNVLDLIEDFSDGIQLYC